MVIKVTAAEAKSKILTLLDEASAGEEVEISKHGGTVARLVAATGPQVLEGSMAGAAKSAGSEDELFTAGSIWEPS